MPTDEQSVRFSPLFERWAGRVRRRLALRHVLTGAAIGLLLATLPAALAWRTRHADLRLFAPSLGLVGAGVGLALARRRAWSDTDVALYLDERLHTHETIATAVELERTQPGLATGPRADGTGASTSDFSLQLAVVMNATAALSSGDVKKARPVILRPLHAAAPLATVALVAIARAPVPAPPVSSRPPGTTQVRIAQADGLEKVKNLARMQARDDAQRERLDKIAKDAEKLREQLETGMEKRDAQDRIARIEDAIVAERLSLGEGEKRAGLESAVGKLDETQMTKRAAKELGDHDLEAMDAELEKLANQREKQDRELAKNALNDAANAAKKNGAPDVAKALEDEKELMERRGARAEMLRDLAEGLLGTGAADDAVKNESEALDRKGSDEAAKKLAGAMGKALEKLTPEERKRLAEKLQQMAKQGGQSGDPEELQDLARALSTAEGQKKLEDELKELAKEETESDEAKRQQALDDAENGAEDTEGDIDPHGGDGDRGQPRSQSGQRSQPRRSPNGRSPQGGGPDGEQAHEGTQSQAGLGGVPLPSNGPGGSGPGSHHDPGTSDHAGKTTAIDAQTLKSRAKGPMNKGSTMPGAVTTYSQGKAGGTANTRGTGDLRIVGPSEVDGVERSDVPEEYRDHVRQYFQP